MGVKDEAAERVIRREKVGMRIDGGGFAMAERDRSRGKRLN